VVSTSEASMRFVLFQNNTLFQYAFKAYAKQFTCIQFLFGHVVTVKIDDIVLIVYFV
jgi:hypothetical protein